MRVLFLGDMAGTGFGSVTQDMGKAMLDLGMDLRFLSHNELGELPEPFASRTLVLNDPNGWLALKASGMVGIVDGTLWSDKWKPDAVILLGDYFAIREVVMATAESVAAFKAIPSMHYIPIEGVDLPPTWKDLWEVVHPVAMSNFGAEQIREVTGTLPPMVYHGIDTDQFRPVSKDHPLWMKSETGDVPDRALRTKDECKRFFGGNVNQKWLLRTDRHMPRKAYPSMLRAIAPVLATHPDTVMVIHCRSFDEGGFMPDTILKYPPSISSRMVNTGFHDSLGGASRNVLTALYNAADVYVSTSAEGFGLTIAEAIACGTPAVGLDYSAVPEVIGPAGRVAPIAGLIDNPYDHFWALPDEKRYGPIVSELLDDDSLRKRLGAFGPGHIRSSFSWVRAAELMRDAIMEVAA